MYTNVSGFPLTFDDPDPVRKFGFWQYPDPQPVDVCKTMAKRCNSSWLQFGWGTNKDLVHFTVQKIKRYFFFL